MTNPRFRQSFDEVFKALERGITETRGFAGQLFKNLELDLRRQAGTTVAEFKQHTNAVVVRVSNPLKVYEITIPISTENFELPTVRLKEFAEGEWKTSEFVGVDLFNTKDIPESFSSLHAYMLHIVKKELPPELLALLAGVQQPATEQAGASSAEASASPTTTADTAAQATVDGEPEPEFSQLFVHCTNSQDLRFKGKLLAGAGTRFQLGRNKAITVFETAGGQYVVVTSENSVWPGETSRQDAQVLKNLSDLPSILGYSRLAKAIYQQLKLDAEVSVE